MARCTHVHWDIDINSRIKLLKGCVGIRDAEETSGGDDLVEVSRSSHCNTRRDQQRPLSGNISYCSCCRLVSNCEQAITGGVISSLLVVPLPIFLYYLSQGHDREAKMYFPGTKGFYNMYFHTFTYLNLELNQSRPHLPYMSRLTSCH